ncbi:MAG: hypothetical protein IKO06_00310 [Alphaproteobacteria bacterium]|nr:hypothetical protein [Alphaproteobacteria bacterium]
MRNLNVTNQKGRSMIEMLGVLAIIGVLSVGGIAGYSKAMMKYRINKTIEQITLIAGNVRSFFAPQGNYNGLTCDKTMLEGSGDWVGCPVVKKAKLVPDEMLEFNNDGSIASITNIWGTPAILAAYSPYHEFTITLGEIPLEACIELVSQDWSNANAERICLDSGPRVSYCQTSPVDVEKATEYCYNLISSTETYSKKVTFYFK